MLEGVDCWPSLEGVPEVITTTSHVPFPITFKGGIFYLQRSKLFKNGRSHERLSTQARQLPVGGGLTRAVGTAFVRHSTDVILSGSRIIYDFYKLNGKPFACLTFEVHGPYEVQSLEIPANFLAKQTS